MFVYLKQWLNCNSTKEHFLFVKRDENKFHFLLVKWHDGEWKQKEEVQSC